MEEKEHQAENSTGGDVGVVNADDFRNDDPLRPTEHKNGSRDLHLRVTSEGNSRSEEEAPENAPGITIAGEEDQGDDKEEEFVDKMRGWPMTVATLFANIALQAALHPPEWLMVKDEHKVSPMTSTARAALYYIINTTAFANALVLVPLMLSGYFFSPKNVYLIRMLVLGVALLVTFVFALGCSDKWSGSLWVIVGFALATSLTVATIR